MEHQQILGTLSSLLQESDRFAKRLKEQAINAIQQGRLSEAEQLVKTHQFLDEFVSKVFDLRRRWHDYWSKKPSPSRGTSSPRKRIEPGLLTPQHVYRIPILEAIVELGGSAPCEQVVERVYTKIANQLNQHDHKPVASDEELPRWRNRIHWCRFQLVREGYLSNNSPSGIWQITERGREYLLAHKSESSNGSNGEANSAR
ncbi:MAG: winged helix-turn-helix domain-containing protein [Gemmatales bacterium]|nr:winged helix-turn-helix domain-containing protein [Gemmatales bacterium]MDW8222089.1 winged helix-turn-helix domain-containing protein [Gemmatales bacterium]